MEQCCIECCAECCGCAVLFEDEHLFILHKPSGLPVLRSELYYDNTVPTSIVTVAWILLSSVCQRPCLHTVSLMMHPARD